MISPEDFKKEVCQLATEMKTKVKEVHLRPMTRKWASCSTSGRLTFNTKLLSESAEFRRQVIIHELLHMSITNHGKMFRVMERSYLRSRC